MKGKSHLGMLLEMNILIGVQLFYVKIPNFGDGH